MSALLKLVGPMLVRLISKKVATELVAQVVNGVIDKLQAKLVGRLPPMVASQVSKAIDEIQAELLTEESLAALLALLFSTVAAGPTAAER